MNERELVRDLAKQYMEVALSDANKERAHNWSRVNVLDAAARPPIILDQLPWNEFAGHEELQWQCADPLLRDMEKYFRSMLFRHRHFGADLVFAPFIPCGKVFTDTGCGVQTVNQDETEHEHAQTHLYEDQLPDEASLSKLHRRVITAFPEKTAEKKAAMEDVVGDIMEVRPMGTMIRAESFNPFSFLLCNRSVFS